MKKLFSQSAASALIRASGMALSLLLGVIMARALAPAGYGTYSYVLAMVALLSIPAKFGLPIQVTRETARAMEKGDVTTVWRLWIWAHRLVLITGALVLVVLTSWLALTANGDTAIWQVWIWGGLLVPILALAHLRSAAIRGLGYVLVSQVPEAILRPAVIIALALCFSIMFRTDFTPAQAVMLNVVGSAVVFLLGLAFMIWRAPPRPPHKTLLRDRAQTQTWFFSALTLGLAMGAQNLGGNMDVVMINLLKDNTEVGLYKVALNGGSLVGFGLQSINMILLPRVAALHSRGDIAEIQDLVTAAARLTLLFTLAACLLLIVFGQSLIIILFGPEFASAYPTLLIVGVGYLVGALCGPVMLVVNMTGHEKATLHGAIGFALLNTVLNVALIPLAGMEGAAIATATSLIALNLYLWHIAWHRAGINTFAFARAANKTTGGFDL